MMERIKAAAVKRADGVIIEDKDHSRCINKSPNGTCRVGSKQGFTTNTGRFVDRMEAGVIAWQAKQIMYAPNGGVIFSEEIWYNGPCEWNKETKSYEFSKKE